MGEQALHGVVLVRYQVAEDLAPALQPPHLARLEREAVHGPTAIVFVLAPGIRDVALSVPKFWLQATRDPRLRLAGLAVVSESAGVRLAAAGFGAANVARGQHFRVRGFDGEPAALHWAQHVVELARASAASAIAP